MENKKEKARRTRLWKCYRWTPEMYDELFRLQNGKCYICGNPPKNVRLAIDHFHFKMSVQRSQNEKKGWLAGCPDLDERIWWGKTKKEAVERAKDYLLARSVRGILCTGHFGCNKRLGRVDSVHFLEKALDYLKNPPANKILDKTHPSVVVSENQLEKN